MPCIIPPANLARAPLPITYSFLYYLSNYDETFLTCCGQASKCFCVQNSRDNPCENWNKKTIDQGEIDTDRSVVNSLGIRKFPWKWVRKKK